MTVGRLLAELASLDVHVELHGDQLRFDAPVGVLTDEHKRDLARRKSDVVAFLREARRLSTDLHAIVPLRSSGTRPPIFAVGGHNGDVFTYRGLAQSLGGDQPFYGLQPPGLDGAGPPLPRVQDVAEYFADHIRAFRPTGPVTVAGYCAGGSTAFETAYQLVESGVPVTRLLLFGAPYCAAYRATGMVRAAGHLGMHAARQRIETVRRTPARRLAGHVRQRLRDRRHRTPPDVTRQRRAALEKVTLRAARSYDPPSLECHLDIVVPNRAWVRAWARPLHWAGHVRSCATFVGPDGCTTDTMLGPEFVGYVADVVTRTQQTLVREAGW